VTTPVASGQERSAGSVWTEESSRQRFLVCERRRKAEPSARSE
jgi:hypothetical protein